MLKKEFAKTKPTCKVTFSLPKEAVNGGKEVKLLGEFNNWNWENGHPMKASKNEFKTVVELEAGRQYQFRYLIDNMKWENDWAADNYLPTPYGVENSVVNVPAVAPTAKKATKTVAAKTTKAAAKKTVAKKTTTAKASAATKKATTKKLTAKKTPAKATKATKVTKIQADDLKKIEGIGPKIAQLLYKINIYTFADLGKAKISTLKACLADAGSRYKMHDPTTWPKQAKMAAKGDWDKLKKWQDELKGGRA